MSASRNGGRSTTLCSTWWQTTTSARPGRRGRLRPAAQHGAVRDAAVGGGGARTPSSMSCCWSTPVTRCAGGTSANAAAPPPQPTSSTEPPAPSSASAARRDGVSGGRGRGGEVGGREPPRVGLGAGQDLRRDPPPGLQLRHRRAASPTGSPVDHLRCRSLDPVAHRSSVDGTGGPPIEAGARGSSRALSGRSARDQHPDLGRAARGGHRCRPGSAPAPAVAPPRWPAPRRPRTPRARAPRRAPGPAPSRVSVTRSETSSAGVPAGLLHHPHHVPRGALGGQLRGDRGVQHHQPGVAGQRRGRAVRARPPAGTSRSVNSPGSSSIPPASTVPSARLLPLPRLDRADHLLGVAAQPRAAGPGVDRDLEAAVRGHVGGQHARP